MIKSVLLSAFALGISFTFIGRAAAEELSPLRLSTDSLATVANSADESSAAPSVAKDTFLRLRAYGVYSDANGNLDWGHNVAGVKHNLDLEDTLGMDLESVTGGILVGFDFGRSHLDLSYDGYYDYDGDRTVGTISFNDHIYTGRVKSELKIHAGMINYGFDFLRLDRLTVTGNLGLRIFSLDASMHGVLTGRSDSIELWAPIPVPGIGVRYDLTDNLYVKGGVAGMYFGTYGNYVELSAEVGYDFNRNFGVFLGARYWGLELNWDDANFDITIPGVYAGVEVRI